MEQNSVHRINGLYWDTEGNRYLGAVVLPRYGAFLSEEKCRLLEDMAGKKVLEIGCGNGQSLCYMGERGVSELWGLDLSPEQLERAKENLAARGMKARLVCAPMEEECGLPEAYFDLVYSIYAIGWTTDLEGTFHRIASCLKKGGTFLFSWSHPIHKCVQREGDRFVFQKSYFDGSWYTVPADFCGGELTLSDRTLSAYINALAGAGFAVERLEEEPEEALLAGESEQAQRARPLPLTFALKARKL